MSGRQSRLFGMYLFLLLFCWLSLGPVVWLRLGDLFVLFLFTPLTVFYISDFADSYSFILIFHLDSFSHQLMICHRGLSDIKCPQVSGTLFSIRANVNNVVVRMVSTCPLISKSFSLFTNHLKISPSAPTTTGITVTFMFHTVFFCSLARSWYLFIFSSFILTLGPVGMSTIKLILSLFFLLTISRSGRLAEIR